MKFIICLWEKLENMTVIMLLFKTLSKCLGGPYADMEMKFFLCKFKSLRNVFVLGHYNGITINANSDLLNMNHISSRK